VPQLSQHCVVSWHFRLNGHAPGDPCVHVPVPLHEPGVSTFVVVLHESHDVLPLGYWHAPVADAHAVAPQVLPVVQAAVQQNPLPLTPHAPLAQLGSLLQATPAASLQAPPAQSKPGAQSLVTLHVDRQALVLAQL